MQWEINIAGQPFTFNEFDLVLIDRVVRRLKTTFKDNRGGEDTKQVVRPVLLQLQYVLTEMNRKLQEGGQA